MQTITKILFFGSLGIASFFALFIFVGMQLSNPLIDDPLYTLVQEGKVCSEHKLAYCLDTNNFYLQRQLKPKLKEANFIQKCSREFQTQIESINEIKNNDQFKLKTDYIDDEYKILTEKHLNQNDVMFRIYHENMFSKDSMTVNGFKVSSDKLEQDLRLFWGLSFANKSNQIQATCLALIYHIFNSEQSRFAFWINTLPLTIPALYGKTTAFELQMLQKDEVANWILKIVEETRSEYREIIYEIKKSWSKEQISSFFNGVKITEADYVHAKYVMQRNSWFYIDNTTHKQAVALFPARNLIKQKIHPVGTSLNPKQIVYDKQKKQHYFEYSTDRELQPNDMLIEDFDFPSPSINFVSAGEHSVKSISSCTHLHAFDYNKASKMLSVYGMELLNQLTENGVFCMTKADIGGVVLRLIGNILNMSPMEQKYCYSQAMSTSGFYERIRIMHQECQQSPQWAQWDPTISISQQIESNIKFFANQQISFEGYAGMRKEHTKDSLNGEAIAKYYQEMTEFNKELLEKVQFVQKQINEEQKIIDAEIPPLPVQDQDQQINAKQIEL